MRYDDRLKAQRDYQWGLDSAREEGRQQGRQEAWEISILSGKIQILQELLGEEPSSSASLCEHTIGELSSMVADLLQRLQSREP